MRKLIVVGRIPGCEWKWKRFKLRWKRTPEQEKITQMLYVMHKLSQKDGGSIAWFNYAVFLICKECDLPLSYAWYRRGAIIVWEGVNESLNKIGWYCYGPDLDTMDEVIGEDLRRRGVVGG